MPRVVKECKSYEIHCECGAEMVVIVTCSPQFKDMVIGCPFCGAVADA